MSRPRPRQAVSQRRPPIRLRALWLTGRPPRRLRAGCNPFIKKLDLELPRGSRCLLIGANGAGKSTLLQVLAGKYMVDMDKIRVIGRAPFHDIELTNSGQLSYLGTAWRKDGGTAGAKVALAADIPARQMIFGVPGVDPERRQRLVEMLDIDLEWKMNKVSDGQRRRVQICIGLLKPYEVLLLDEITVDMDVVGRMDLLDFFRQECDERGATIVYATHIFDGLENWITHVAYVARGELQKGGLAGEVFPAEQLGVHGRLYETVEKWIEEDNRIAPPELEDDAPRKVPEGMGRHMAYYR